MVIASVMALISYKLKQPMVIGYIVAGMIIGPYTPPFSLLINLDILNLFSEIGIILLLFVVGMEFPIEKLRSIGRKALVIALSANGWLDDNNYNFHNTVYGKDGMEGAQTLDILYNDRNNNKKIWHSLRLFSLFRRKRS